MTPAESVSALYSLYAKTVAHLDEPGWDAPPPDANVLGVTPEGCTLPDGSQGVNYVGGGRGPGQADAVTAATNVEAFWKSLGLTADVSKSSNPKNDRITSTGDDTSLNAQYVVNESMAYISIVTTCVPGNELQLIQGVQKHREQQSATPTP